MRQRELAGPHGAAADQCGDEAVCCGLRKGRRPPRLGLWPAADSRQATSRDSRAPWAAAGRAIVGRAGSCRHPGARSSVGHARRRPRSPGRVWPANWPRTSARSGAGPEEAGAIRATEELRRPSDSRRVQSPRRLRSSGRPRGSMRPRGSANPGRRRTMRPALERVANLAQMAGQPELRMGDQGSLRAHWRRVKSILCRQRDTFDQRGQ